MTREDIIRMAREAGFAHSWSEAAGEALERFAALVAAHEREKQSGLVEIIENLWNIIDDVDTYGDMAKADDKLYRSLVERRQKDRWKTGITTDGYTLNIPDVAVSVEAAVLAEREACAKVCDSLHDKIELVEKTEHYPGEYGSEYDAGQGNAICECADAIRARSNE